MRVCILDSWRKHVGYLSSVEVAFEQHGWYGGIYRRNTNKGTGVSANVVLSS